MAAFLTSKQRAVFERLCVAIENRYGVDETMLVEVLSRAQNIVRPRQIASYVLREKFHFTLTTIAELFKKDHTTIIHGVATVKRLGLLEEADLLYADIMAIPTSAVGRPKRVKKVGITTGDNFTQHGDN